jgi:dTMP kinase
VSARPRRRSRLRSLDRLCFYLSKSFHLLFPRDELLRKLQAGTTLVVDRYAYSGVAFTAAKALPGLDRAWCTAPDAGLPAPDAVYFFSLTAEAAAARGGYGGERYEKEAFQKAVLKHFEELRDPSWRVIDASGSMEAVQTELREAAGAVVRRCGAGGAPLRRLWGGGEPLAPVDRNAT